VTVGIAAFAAIAVWLHVRHVPALDASLLTFCRSHRNAALTTAMRVASDLGEGPAYVALFAWMAAALWRRRRRALGYLAACGVGAGLADVLLKLVFARPRPAAALRLVAAGGYSFPSGHSMSSAAFYGALAVIATLELRRSRWAVAALCVALAFAIGVSRVYLSVHYPSDVAAGWVLGASCAIGLRPLLGASPARSCANPG
jgi:undecaprenyl-diphosphatase